MQPPLLGPQTRLSKRRNRLNRRSDSFYEQDFDFLDPVSIAGLGVSIFSAATPFLTGGSFSWQTNTPINYKHNWSGRQPPRYKKRTMRFRMIAHHPRYGIGNQNFWFRLSYDFNGHDLRDVEIVGLPMQSSRLTASTFRVKFEGRPYSEETNPVAEIKFNISGDWDPVGSGIAGFWGDLFVKADGSAQYSIQAEDNWVWHGSSFTQMTTTPL